MNMVSRKVAPYVGNASGVDNVVLSLLALAPPQFLRCTATPGKLPDFQQSQMTMSQLSVSAMADIGFTGASSLAARSNAKVTCFISDLTLSTGWIGNPDTDSIIKKARFGAGIRLGLTALDVHSDYATSIGKLAAAGSTNVAQVSCEAEVVGGGSQFLAALTPLIGMLAGPFTMETLNSLGAVRAELEDVLSKGAAGLSPSLVEVDIDVNQLMKVTCGQDIELLPEATAEIFALERAWRWQTGNEAVAHDRHWNKGVNVEAILRTYEHVLGLGPGQQVTQAAQTAAHSILIAGR